MARSIEKVDKMKRVRAEILDFKPYTPGLTIEEIKEKYGLATVIKLASNENPLGTSPLVQKAVARHCAAGFRYPRNHVPRLTSALSGKLGIDSEMIVAGNGSDEVIDMLMRVVAEPGKDHVLCYESSFSMYRMTAKLCGVGYREVPRDFNHALPLEALADAVDENTALVFVTSPDNPTGHAATADKLVELAGKLPEKTLLVVDEAYIEFANPADEYDLIPAVRESENIVLLRTFSKAYGLAGFRLGYGIMPVWLANYMRRARIPFTVNHLAEEAGIAAVSDEHFLRTTLKTVHAGRAFLSDSLREMGCDPLPSQSNFVMFKVSGDADQVFESMLARGVIIRPLKSFGLPEYFRVNVGTEAENRAFVMALGEVLNNG